MVKKPEPRRSALWIIGILALLCPGVLCGGGYFLYRSWFSDPASSLPAELAAARAEGIPLDPDDLRPRPPIPDNQNAAKVYAGFFPQIERLLKRYPSLTKAESNLSNGTATTAEQLEIENALNEAKGALGPITKAGSRPFCDFHFRYEDGFNLLLPQFADAKNVVKLLVARAHFEGEDGHVEQALATLTSAGTVGHHVGQSPFLLASFVEAAIDAIVIKEFCRLLQRCSGDRALLEKAQRTLDGFGPLIDLRRAFRGEVVFGRVSIHDLHTTGDIEDMSSGSGNDGPNKRGTGTRFSDTMVAAFEAKLISDWRWLFANMPKDPNDWRGAYDALKKSDDRIESDHSLTNVLNRVLFPVFDGAALAVGHQQANRRLAATAIRLMTDHLATGKYPATLPNYGDISIDPFDGKSLRYRLDGNGFTIYSIDRDFRDNGGQKKTPDHPGDLVYTFK